MNSKIVALVIGLVLLVFLLVFSMTYSVRFNEVAILTTFGEATEESVQREPGLHFKWPTPIQSAKKYDSRLQTVDTRLETHATRDGLQVIAQAFVLWRIDGDRVLEFDQAYGIVQAASEDIEARMRSAVGALSEFQFEQLIGANNDLAGVEKRIEARLTAAGADSKSLAELGVKIEKVGLSQIVLPVETSKTVVERMKKERDEASESIRAEGDADAQRIKSDGQKKADVILSHAERLASRIRARGDQIASASVMRLSANPEFATFLIWLDALEKSTKGATTIFMPTTFQPFHLLNFQDGDFSGVPVPQDPVPGISSNRPLRETLGLAGGESIASPDASHSSGENN